MTAESIVLSNTKRIISERGLKNSFVAEKIGMDRKLFSAMLNGRKFVRLEHVKAISDVLGISPGKLFEEQAET